LIPCPDPWDVARKLAHLPNLLFLDSADRTTERGRYSYVAAEPVRISTTTAVPASESPTPHILSPHVWEIDDEEIREWEPPNGPALPDLPPFQGGIAGFFGYGINRELEWVGPNRFDDFPFHDLVLFQYDWVIAFDHFRHRGWLISHRSPGRSPSEIIDDLRKPIPDSFGPVDVPRSKVGSPQNPLPFHPDVTSNFTRDQYLSTARKAIDYVHAGDCFQVNLSQRLLAPLREHPLELYGRLRERNAAPYGCYFDLGDFQILSASPEQFLKVSDGEVVTRPIKGTRPRGKTPEEDRRIVRELQSNPKDRAENVMIVDLLRNDLGRVCEYGSIHVPMVCEVESFAHVHHLVSEVHGKLRPDKTPFDLLRAAFPGGSVTGAPKVRAMEIIAELEPTARGPYCGSVGFVGFDGTMDSNILIRTFTAGRGWVQFPVGGGIVADSDPATEYEETLHKAKGMLEALNP
jgi:para-aminobenzoate synthetase component 1